MVLLGASGCGKTTALRMLAGLESVDSGAVFIDGVDVTDHQPGERDIAMVFQNYALYPQMTVAGNLGFRLSLTGAPPSAVARRVRRRARPPAPPTTPGRGPQAAPRGQPPRGGMGRATLAQAKVLPRDEALRPPG